MRRNGSGDVADGPLQQIPDERVADAEAKHHERANAQMIHQTDMVVGIGVPGTVDLERTG